MRGSVGRDEFVDDDLLGQHLIIVLVESRATERHTRWIEERLIIFLDVDNTIVIVIAFAVTTIAQRCIIRRGRGH